MARGNAKSRLLAGIALAAAPAAFVALVGPQPLGQALFSLRLMSASAVFLNDTGWRGYALARSGDLVGAADAFGSATVNAYNRGNVLVRLGRFKQALEAYDVALEADPEDEDARFNKAVVEKILDLDATPEGGTKGDANASASRDRHHGGAGNQEGDTRSTGVGYTGNKEGSSSATSQGGNKVQKVGRGSTEASKTASEQASGSAGLASGRGRSGGDLADITAQLTANQRRVAHSYTAQSVKPTVDWLQTVPDNPGGFLKLQIRAEQKRRQVTEIGNAD